MKPPGQTSARLDILVENRGRINYGQEMHHPKGITPGGGVIVDNTHLSDFTIYRLPLSASMSISSLLSPLLTPVTAPIAGPAFYQSMFTVSAGDIAVECMKMLLLSIIKDCI